MRRPRAGHSSRKQLRVYPDRTHSWRIATLESPRAHPDDQTLTDSSRSKLDIGSSSFHLDPRRLGLQTRGTVVRALPSRLSDDIVSFGGSAPIALCLKALALQSPCADKRDEPQDVSNVVNQSTSLDTRRHDLGRTVTAASPGRLSPGSGAEERSGPSSHAIENPLPGAILGCGPDDCGQASACGAARQLSRP